MREAAFTPWPTTITVYKLSLKSILKEIGHKLHTFRVDISNRKLFDKITNFPIVITSMRPTYMLFHLTPGKQYIKGLKPAHETKVRTYSFSRSFAAILNNHMHRNRRPHTTCLGSERFTSTNLLKIRSVAVYDPTV